MVKNVAAMRETQVRFQGLEDPLEKEMATHSTIFAWRIPPRLAGYIPWGCKRVRHDLKTKQNQPIIIFYSSNL